MSQIIPRFKGKVVSYGSGFCFVVYIHIGECDPIEMFFDKQIYINEESALAAMKNETMNIMHTVCKTMGVEIEGIYNLKDGIRQTADEFVGPKKQGPD